MVRSVGGAGCGTKGSSSDMLAKRHDACRMWTAEECQRPQLRGEGVDATRE
jgi:hypothetical protein